MTEPRERGMILYRKPISSEITIGLFVLYAEGCWNIKFLPRLEQQMCWEKQYRGMKPSCCPTSSTCSLLRVVAQESLSAQDHPLTCLYGKHVHVYQRVSVLITCTMRLKPAPLQNVRLWISMFSVWTIGARIARHVHELMADHFVLTFETFAAF